MNSTKNRILRFNAVGFKTAAKNYIHICIFYITIWCEDQDHEKEKDMKRL